MPKDPSIQRVLIIGSGPIVIGQACEFDYSGTQACRALREEGVEVVLLNSNPASIMTDPEMADRTYLEPITPEVVGQILAAEAERGSPVDCVLPTLGGQTGLNCAMESARLGILDRHSVRMIGADCETIRRAEDREVFKRTVLDAGLDVPASGIATNYQEALEILDRIKFPVCIRPAFTLGGTGGGMARTPTEFEFLVQDGLASSPISQILIEEDLSGWKEFELEMMRDRRDNVVVVCSIENLDPMGVHTGDSITVAPALTLSDREYQGLRDAAITVMRAVGVETGGANIQFAVNPRDGRRVVIEMNPRVSRSSALASKATGFPIAKIATKLALGYTLNEIRNDITRETPACFEPTIDYVVVKMPRFAFEKFPEADETLGTSMKSVGEAMAFGRTFKEAFQKCIRSMEIKRPGYGLHPNDKWFDHWEATKQRSDEARDGKGTEGRNRATTAGEPRTPALHAQRLGSVRADVEGVGETVHAVFAGAETPHDLKPTARSSLGEPPADWLEQSSRKWPVPEDVLRQKISTPCQGRIYYIRYALKLGWNVERIHALSGIDPWFLDQMAELAAFEERLLRVPVPKGDGDGFSPEFRGVYTLARSHGYSDSQLRSVWQLDERAMARIKTQLDRPVFKQVDTCAAEFEAYTPYYYSTHERPFFHLEEQDSGAATPSDDLCRVGKECVADGNPSRGAEIHDDELQLNERPKVVVLGGGPNRIGQGIEFDYCCVHAAMAARELGFEAAMINSNPETVSTDYDISDLLFFEPLTHEDVYHVCERLNGGKFQGERHEPGQRSLSAIQPQTNEGATSSASGNLPLPGRLRGAIVQYGGQTPLNLAQGLSEAGVPILGTSPASIHEAEDRECFQRVVQELGLRQPPCGTATTPSEAAEIAEHIGYPVLVRPSYVLGGRGMQVCNNPSDLHRYVEGALKATDRDSGLNRHDPILVDKFLLDAIEVDVDAVSDYGDPSRDPALGRCDICGIMEHIEEAGIHSGDSCCVLPPYSLSPALVDEIKYQVKLLARRLKVWGLMNVQFAIQGRVLYVIEVNPRASRTIPFVSKATGVPWAKVATKVMLGRSLDQALHEIGISDVPAPRWVSVKAPVFPFKKLRKVDMVLGPEMRSTGEVMGIDESYSAAFAKALAAAGLKLPVDGRVLVSVNDPDKPRVVSIARELHEMGFEIHSTIKTHQTLADHGVPSRIVSKHDGHGHPFLLDMIRNRELDLLINTPIHTGSSSEEGRWRIASLQLGIPLITNLAGARAAVGAIRALRSKDMRVHALQEGRVQGRVSSPVFSEPRASACAALGGIQPANVSLLEPNAPVDAHRRSSPTSRLGKPAREHRS